MFKSTPIFLQDISAPCIPNICHRTFSGVLRLGISKFVVTLSNLLSIYESKEFAFTILRFSSLYLIACIGETHVPYEYLCEYRDVRVQFNGTVHGGLIILSFSEVMNNLCLINAYMCIYILTSNCRIKTVSH